MRRLWYSSVVVFVWASVCFGWGGIGHKTAAIIADHYLSPEARSEVARLLGDESMADVALWGDQVATQPAYNWTLPHVAYVESGADSFDMQRDCADGKCVVARIVLLKKTMQDPKAEKAAKADALRLLIHFIPDMHNPVHVVRKQDQAVQADFFGQRFSVHRVWDDLLISRLKTTPTAYADELLGQIAPSRVAAWTRDMDPAHWATESYRHALNVAYALPPDGRLGQDYVDRCLPIVRQRLSMAGVRLAAVLNEIFGGQMPTSAANATPADAKGKEADAKRPVILGHRGVLTYAPENTLAAFGLCMIAGVDIELDVYSTKDGQVVVIHDPTVDRTTDGKGPVSDLTLDQIKRMDAGSWFHPDFAGERVPTLDEVFDYIVRQERRPTTIAINMKHIDEAVIDGVIQAVRKYRLFDRTFVFDTSLDVIRTFKQRESRIRCAVSVRDRSKFQDVLALDFIDAICTGPQSREVIEQIHAAGKKVYFLVVDDAEVWVRAKADGVDGICTNYPLRMKRAAWPVPPERDWDHYIPAKYRHADYYKPLKSGE